MSSTANAEAVNEILEIRISRPLKTPTSYVFELACTAPNREPALTRFGVNNANFEIPHHEVWDSFLPLMYLSRNGGPLFRKAITRAQVRADFPLHATVVDFFARRARRFGLELQVNGPCYERAYDIPTRGEALLFGGGKDSRLLLGCLREVGIAPRVVSAEGGQYASDIADALTFETLDHSMANRIVPALMLLPSRVWYGSGLGEVHFHQPWQQYFDIAAPPALLETSTMLKSLGLDITIEAPQNVLPYNLTQMMLARRYPALFAGQVSVVPHKASDKNLHVTLLKLYHGISADDHCGAELFATMLTKFVQQSADPDRIQFGYRANREIIEREMRAIISRLHNRGELQVPLAVDLPETWQAPWIDFIHAYIHPGLDNSFMNIYSEYADIWPRGAPGLPVGLRPYLSDGTIIA